MLWQVLAGTGIVCSGLTTNSFCGIRQYPPHQHGPCHCWTNLNTSRALCRNLAIMCHVNEVWKCLWVYGETGRHRDGQRLGCPGGSSQADGILAPMLHVEAEIHQESMLPYLPLLLTFDTIRSIPLNVAQREVAALRAAGVPGGAAGHSRLVKDHKVARDTRCCYVAQGHCILSWASFCLFRAQPSMP